MDIVEFLTAQLDTDQARAEAARPGPWFASGGVLSAAAGEYRDDIGEIWDPNNDHGDDEATAAHIARHDPARVLADIAAKRKLLDLAAEMAAVDRWTEAETIRRCVAAPYADRPGFNPSWRVEA
jgi:hypothetical protein